VIKYGTTVSTVRWAEAISASERVIDSGGRVVLGSYMKLGESGRGQIGVILYVAERKVITITNNNSMMMNHQQMISRAEVV